MARIVLLEDDEAIREAVAGYLRREDYEVEVFEDGTAVSEACDRSLPDLCILDVSVPGRDGFSVSADVRARSPVPIIFLTSRDDEQSRVSGFEIGADDYVVKPFSPRELVLRVNAVLRRVASRPSTVDGTWEHEGRSLRIDAELHDVVLDGRLVELTATEWRILEMLVRAQPAVVERRLVVETVLGYGDSVETRAIDTHMKNLRAKLGSSGWIETIRSVGYRFAGRAVP